jgi:hypothetical protein
MRMKSQIPIFQTRSEAAIAFNLGMDEQTG